MMNPTPSSSAGDLIERRISWPFVLFGFSFALLLFAHQGLLSDADTFWHLATGRWIIEHGLIPTADPFSHTKTGAPWQSHEWLSALLLAIAHDAGGWSGVVVLTASAIAGTIALMFRALLTYLRPIPACVLVLLSFLVLIPHLMARPHVLVMPVMVIWVAALVSARDQNRPPAFPWALLMVLWANLHGSFVVGLGLTGVLALEGVWAAKLQVNWRDVAKGWLRFIVLAGLGSLITPFGWHGWLFPFQVQGMEKSLALITEWRPVNFQEFQPLALWMFFSLAFALYRGLRVPPFRLFLLLSFLYLALAHLRYADLIGLFVPLLVAPTLAAQWPDTMAKNAIQARIDASRGAVLLLGIVAAGGLLLNMGDVVPKPSITPATALEAAKKSGLHGPVLNEYDFGGYLIYSGVRTFIDGRADLFGDEFVDHYYHATSTFVERDSLLKLLNNHSVTWTLGRADSLFVQRMDQMPGWYRLYTDAIAVVHARKDK